VIVAEHSTEGILCNRQLSFEGSSFFEYLFGSGYGSDPERVERFLEFAF